MRAVLAQNRGAVQTGSAAREQGVEMSTVERKAQVVWKGNLDSGWGMVNTDRGTVRDTPIDWASRVGEGSGPTPEELIAAALGSCYSMSLSHWLTDSGHEPEQLEVVATCILDKGIQGIKISHVDLDVTGQVEGLTDRRFREIAEMAEEKCPVARLFVGNASMHLDTHLQHAAVH